MTREIRGLQMARFCERPKSIPPSRRKGGAKGAGQRYESALAKSLPFALHGPWIEFWDANGRGICQPDFVLRTREGVFVLEAKMSDVEGARVQLRGLYEPLLQKILGEEVFGIGVVRHLSGVREICGGYYVCDGLGATLNLAMGRPKVLVLWHWRERTPVGAEGLAPQPPIPAQRALLRA